MARLSILFGSLLVFLGIIGYFLQPADARSATAFIPAGFGLLLILPGLLAVAKPTLNKHAMHVSALVALLGVSGLGMGLPKLLSSEPLARPLATTSQIILGTICLVFLVLCIRSFINARRNR